VWRGWAGDGRTRAGAGRRGGRETYTDRTITCQRCGQQVPITRRARWGTVTLLYHCSCRHRFVSFKSACQDLLPIYEYKAMEALGAVRQ